MFILYETQQDSEAAALNGYRAIMPDKSKVFILQNQVAAISQPLKTITLEQDKEVFEKPNTSAAKITVYPAGEKIQVIDVFNNFYLVKHGLIKGWISSIAID